MAGCAQHGAAGMAIASRFGRCLDFLLVRLVDREGTRSARGRLVRIVAAKTVGPCQEDRSVLVMWCASK